MKFSTIVCLSVCGFVSAAPSTPASDTNKAIGYSTNNATVLFNQRDLGTCFNLMQIIGKISNSTALAVAAGGGFLAGAGYCSYKTEAEPARGWNIEAWRLNREAQKERCRNIGLGVAGAVAFVFTLAREGLKAVKVIERSTETISLKASILEALLDQGDSFGEVTSFPVSQLHRRAEGNYALLDHFHISQLRIANITMDTTVKLYEEGHGTLLVYPPGVSSSSGANLLGKRGANPGVKVNFVTSHRSHLPRKQQIDFAHQMAARWKSDMGKYQRSDWYGLVKEAHQGIFYLRTITEVKAYGNEYETVNQCGQLGRAL